MLRDLRVDVLIIGGGVSGLWLLKDLTTAGYSALVLEKGLLGGVQTCHSHVYIHQGHMYWETDLASAVHHALPLWNQCLADNGLQKVQDGSYFGFQNVAEAKRRTFLWSRADLTLKCAAVPETEFPIALRGGSARVLLRSDEYCLKGPELIAGLSRGLEERQVAIDRVVKFDFAPDGATVLAVHVVLPDGERLRIQCGATVLAAGAGNQELLHLATRGRPGPPQTPDQQQIRKSHMLVLRGRPGSPLPPLTGVFPDVGGLFIVSRPTEDGSVWLVSDSRGPKLGWIEDWMAHDVKWWLPPALAALKNLAPQCFADANKLLWAVYDAPKAEGRSRGFLPHEIKLLQFDFRNLWALWPTKLTLAPVASCQATALIGRYLGHPSPEVSFESLKPRRPALARERWEETLPLQWNEFARLYNLSAAQP